MKIVAIKSLLTLFILANSPFAFAQKEVKGLLPEVKLNSNDEDSNQEKARSSELLISQSENKAIESLQRIINKKKGTVEEPDLLYRLAELYMRRAKSGRFFDLYEKNQNDQSTNKNAQKSLASAIKIYDSIISRFPKYKNLDFVHFNLALASLQTKQIEKAKKHYTIITTQYLKSTILPDALLELGELYYDQQNFESALAQFKKIEAFPKSKAYPYGIYKSAWCYYNMKDTEQGIQKLKYIVKTHSADQTDLKKYNLRQEALRDLTLFVGETVKPEELYSFFSAITTPDELGEIIINLANLYESHSRHKEISIFVKEFISRNPQNKNTAKAYSKLINVHETLKQRDLVLDYLSKLSDFCYVESVDSNCKEDFRKISLEISKKWWDIWLKNKNHIEFSKLTESAFNILLTHDDPASPDSVSRFAYAELLFQLGKFEKASDNYEIVSKDVKFDPAKKHDALYGSIYSIDKMIEKNREAEDLSSERLQSLTLRYVNEYPKGEHVEPLKFKLGFIAYQKQNSEEALKYLIPLAKNTKDNQLKVKSEDIILDIYNLNKDYKSIQSFAAESISSSTNTDRKSSLSQIKEEAHFSQLQIDTASADVNKKIDTLLAFSNEHKESKLSKEALWQSISLAYANGLEIKGADLSLKYYSKFPKDSKNLDSIKEAIKAYTEAGYINQSIQTLKELAKLDPKNSNLHLQTSCDLLSINSQNSEAQKCYMSLMDKSDKNKKLEIISKILNTLNQEDNFTEVPGLENIVLSENLEPYATQVLISKAKNLLLAGKPSEAFQLSLKVNSRPVSADVRAEARLIQAEILEKEFISQSVRSSESRFALVLGIKTEKFDKAYTAYNSTIKMTKNPKIQERALVAIGRLYTHFIDTLMNVPIPKTLKKEEQLALKAELEKMTLPFVQKREDNLSQIKLINKSYISEEKHEISWNTLALDKTIEPSFNFPQPNKISSFLPASFKVSENSTPRLTASLPKSSKCDSKQITAQSIGTCISIKKFIDAESIALQLTATKENRPLGLYYLSVIADQRNQYYKSLWLTEKALTLEPNQPIFLYQKGKLLYSKYGISEALPYFEKSIDLRKSSKEVSLITGLKSFNEKDFISASEGLKDLSLEDQEKFSVATLIVEALAQKGSPEEAVKWGEKFLSNYPSHLDMYLQLARVHEQFSVNPQKSRQLASENYKKALAKTQDVDQRDWLKRKISYLNEVKQ